MSFLIGSKSQASQTAAVSGLQLQSSAYGKAVPIVYGTTRIAPNLIWYGNFTATPQGSSGGGKGGAAGSGGKSGNSGTTYTYQTAVAFGLSEGPINGIGTVFVSNSTTTIAALGLSEFAGTYGQAVWGYLATAFPEQAVPYSGIAYLATPSYQLGSNAELPNNNFEVQGIFATSLSSLGVEDADPSLVVADLLSNPNYGAGFPLTRIGDLSVYQAYCIANGLWISPGYTTQAQASSVLDDIATATNSAFVWSSGVLTLVPYGDEAITANGYTYTPPATPIYDLGEDDFMDNSNATPSSASTGEGHDPVLLTRQRPSDAINSISIEYLDRSNSYNPAIVTAQDLAMIEQFGLRQSPSTQMHMFADMNAAQMSVQLQLQQQYIRNTYQFTLDQRYVLLDPMDIVTLTEPNLGLNKQWVRITEITENDDSSLTFIAEEYLDGVASAPLYSYQQGLGYSNNYNASPGNANAPVVFEPTAELAGSLEVWIAASGGSLWGGCDVYISTVGNTYKNAGRITGSARMGTLSAALPYVMENTSGQTVDATNTLAVNLSESNGELLSGSQSDATSLVTLCYVDGEYIAYQTATLTAANQYNLTWLVRGAYGTTPAAHLANSNFARLDSSIFKYPYTQDYIGTTIYIKLVSFNIYNGGGQNLSDVQAYSYQLQGTALSSPLPDVTNLVLSYNGTLAQVSWDAVQDFRTVQYEIRKGAAWTGAQVVGIIASPPFTLQGDGTYWVSAYSQPVAGLQVYSENPADILVSGSVITNNVIATYDEAATSWSGTCGGTAGVSGSDVVTSGSGNILTDADFLGTSDILFYGGGGSGTYTIPSAHIINIGRVAPCQVMINWSSQGVKITDNILAVYDYLNDTDILDWAASANTDVYPQIALSQDGVTWSAWQQYVAGSYSAMAFKAQMQIQVDDPQTQAILSAFVFSVDVPDRDDHYVNMSIASGGTTITFTPDGSATAAPFNGGPQGSPTLPAIQVTILNAQAGDLVVVSSVSLSSCKVQVLNGGSGVARNVNVLVQGY